MAHPVPTAPTGVDAGEWESAVKAIRDYCEWHIAPEFEETVTVDGPGGTLLALPTQRLVSVASITNDGTAVTDPEWSSSGLVRGGWSSKFRGVTVTMTHGYEEWPADLTSVAKDMIAAAGRGGVSSVASGAHQFSYEDQAERHAAVLDRYRLGGLP